MFVDYIVLVCAFIVIGLIISLIFSKILRVKVFGGFFVMFLVATAGALLGLYYFPRIDSLFLNKLNIGDSMMGSVILIILLHISTPKSLK